MSTSSYYQSALCIGNGDDDAVVLVVGGYGGTGKEAALLTNRPHQAEGEQDNPDSEWRWQQLSPMLEKRSCCPGLLPLGGKRVLVCGGYNGRRTVEMLQLPRDDNEKGVWTLLPQPMTQGFRTSFLVNLNHRMFGVGVLLFFLVALAPQQP